MQGLFLFCRQRTEVRYQLLISHLAQLRARFFQVVGVSNDNNLRFGMVWRIRLSKTEIDILIIHGQLVTFFIHLVLRVQHGHESLRNTIQ